MIDHYYNDDRSHEIDMIKLTLAFCCEVLLSNYLWQTTFSLWKEFYYKNLLGYVKFPKK
jgi:hypothetical protein